MCRWLAIVVAVSLAGCAELGVIPDGTTVSVGQSNRGSLIDAKRLPDRGRGFVSRPQWIERGYRFGTDELIALVTNVASRMSAGARDSRLVVADLSAKTGGGSVLRFHRSHQSGRDVDLLYYMRDAAGKPFEADAMRVFDADGRAIDGSGITVDIPRMWRLVKQLVMAPEAPVQFIFMYEPIAAMILERAAKIGEPELVIARARKALYQPGHRAPHDDHLHVRVYCSSEDRRYGCIDTGPMDLLLARNAETQQNIDLAQHPGKAGVIDLTPHSLVGSAAHPGKAGVIDLTPHSLVGSAAHPGRAGVIDLTPHSLVGSAAHPGRAGVIDNLAFGEVVALSQSSQNHSTPDKGDAADAATPLTSGSENVAQVQLPATTPR